MEKWRGKWARPGRNIALGMLMREGKDVKEWNVAPSFLPVSRASPLSGFVDKARKNIRDAIISKGRRIEVF